MRSHPFEWKAPRECGLSEDLPDDLLLECALSIYQQTVDPGYRLSTRPDRDDRKNRAVDGIFKAATGDPIAIEITKLLTFERQSETRVLFTRYLKHAEQQLAARLPRGIWCELPAAPFVYGFEWHAFGECLAAYIFNVAASLPPGGTWHDIEGLPFPILLGRDPKWHLPFCFVTANPPAAQIRTDLINHMIKALEHKREELHEWLENRHRTVLMLASADCNFYCITWDLAYRVFLEAERCVGSSHVQDVLFAFTGDYGTAYCMAFKGDTVFRNALNSRTMTFGPEYSNLWLDEVSA